MTSSSPPSAQNRPAKRDVDADEDGGQEPDVGPEQPEPAVDVADEGVHELVDDVEVVHLRSAFMSEAGGMSRGPGPGGRPVGPRDEEGRPDRGRGGVRPHRPAPPQLIGAAAACRRGRRRGTGARLSRDSRSICARSACSTACARKCAAIRLWIWSCCWAVSARSWLVACCACRDPSAPWLRATISAKRLGVAADIGDDLALHAHRLAEGGHRRLEPGARGGRALVPVHQLVEVLRVELPELLRRAGRPGSRCPGPGPSACRSAEAAAGAGSAAESRCARGCAPCWSASAPRSGGSGSAG